MSDQLREHVAAALYGDGWETAGSGDREHHLDAADTVMAALAAAPGAAVSGGRLSLPWPLAGNRKEG